MIRRDGKNGSLQARSIWLLIWRKRYPWAFGAAMAQWECLDTHESRSLHETKTCIASFDELLEVVGNSLVTSAGLEFALHFKHFIVPMR